MVLMLDNIRSTYNVGAILRTAEGMGVEKVIFGGVTPAPCGKPGQLPHLVERERCAIHKTALGAEEMVACEYVADVKQKLAELRKMFHIVVGLENNISDERLVRLGEFDPREKFGDSIVLVLGEEVKGISPELYDEIDYFLEIPMQGRKESFNVSVAAGIAMWGLMHEGEVDVSL